LAITTDNIADNILSAVNCLDFYAPQKLPTRSIEICKSISACITEINRAVLLIESQKHINALKKICFNIEHLEKDAMRLFSLEKAELLHHSYQPIEQIKINEWLEKLEILLASCSEYAIALDSTAIKTR
jgi:hypothetical protein